MAFIKKYGFPGLSFLILLACALHFAYPVIYALSVNKTRSEQLQLINEGHTSYSRLVLSIAAFEQAYQDDDHELNVDGNMYELVSFSKNGNIVHCTVLSDPGESLLHQQLAQHVNHEKSGKTQKQSVYWWPAIFEAGDMAVVHMQIPEAKGLVGAKNTLIQLNNFNCELIRPPDVV